MNPTFGSNRTTPSITRVIFDKILQFQGSFITSSSTTPARAQQIRDSIASNVSSASFYTQCNDYLNKAEDIAQQLSARIQKCGDFSSLSTLRENFKISAEPSYMVIPTYMLLMDKVDSLKKRAQSSHFATPKEKTSVIESIETTLEMIFSLYDKSSEELRKCVKELNLLSQDKLKSFLERHDDLKSCLERLSESSDTASIQDFISSMSRYVDCVSACRSSSNATAREIPEVYAQNILEECYKAIKSLKEKRNPWFLENENKLWFQVFSLALLGENFLDEEKKGETRKLAAMRKPG